jgi:hypothetical protein
VKEDSYIEEEEHEFEGVHMDNGHRGHMKPSSTTLRTRG